MHKIKETLKSFEVIRKIGSGSSAKIYLLKNKETKGFCALREVKLKRKEDLKLSMNETKACGLKHKNIIEYEFLGVCTRPKELKYVLDKFEENSYSGGLGKETILKSGIKIEHSSSPLQIEKEVVKPKKKKNSKFFQEKQILSNLEKNTILSEKTNGKNVSAKPYYSYYLTSYYNFTLKDYVEFRNTQFFDNKHATCISFSSQPFDCLVPFTDNEGIEKLIPAEFLVHSFSSKNTLNKSFIHFLITNVIEGVEYLHSKGLVHTDISLSNIFIGNEKDYIPKLGDFGEIQSIETTDKKEDIYRLGILWFELLFPIKTTSEKFHILEKIKETNSLPSEFVNANKGEAKIIKICLRKNKKIGIKRLLKLIKTFEKESNLSE
ncbi:PEK kinase [Tubulinosema ratisbonensis]|uniref:non-specific serine/threonine protein kinase n=1 Tax=Tubulinosema ratisbonensis TaxID=291195 RepID=A0A437AKV5_9MICR|nr:PEK kinase [Tubulinosema ratisbonensis]